MKTRLDDLYQYNILLDKGDMDQLKKKGSISIDTHLEILGPPFIHIIATKELKDELNNEMEVKINLNESVKFKLTDYGKDIYYHRFDESNEFIKQFGGKPIEPTMPEVDEEGYTKMQLWYFMYIYGKYMEMGCENVVEHLEIIYEPEKFDIIYETED